MPILDLAISSKWAMLEEDLDKVMAIASRQNDVSVEALEAYKATQANSGDRLTVRGGVGILALEGPMFKRANMFTAISGATSYEMAMTDFQAALDDSSIHSIILKIDSPGGEVSGCDEFAQAIFAARGQKPITAFISGAGASAAYWIASAADEIVASEVSVIGSIGVIMGIRQSADDDTVEFVSSQSPNKRPDMATKAGKDKLQARVDDLADVFITAVARNRGVNADTVINKFGAGGIEIGAKAVKVGLIDKVGQLEETISALNSRGSSRRSTPTATGDHSMSGKTEASGANTADTLDVDKIRAEAAATAGTDVQTRIKAILANEHASDLPKTANYLAFETSVDAKEATALLAAAAEDMAAKAPADDENSSATYEQRKTDADTLGMAAPDAIGTTEEANAGWGKAIAETNGRLRA